ncbi:hypothetical protein [Noviherbaspirillum sedimenti]|nr:hypothetical protein [Noviherbaspirillum sedimenti]
MTDEKSGKSASGLPRPALLPTFFLNAQHPDYNDFLLVFTVK